MRCGVVMMMVGVVMEGVRGQVTERMRVEILPPDGTSTETVTSESRAAAAPPTASKDRRTW